MFEYDFRNNKSYDVYAEAMRAKEDKDVALWFTNHMPIDKLVEVFVKTWAEETNID